ncbi:hypothetical protein DCS_05917 [Drechmeria coniospora]|uniref:Uncharacterized protein n=1 Tax=Drechmeria coniospora TaxID=98403 RepID=A0A151GA57_DRECN|nr:hypothetical protein DCS_05917 [Drechmeria coniospora]KYK53968.1 hypothetical protein DCS_05917 [Drechmeria coniospora]
MDNEVPRENPVEGERSGPRAEGHDLRRAPWAMWVLATQVGSCGCRRPSRPSMTARCHVEEGHTRQREEVRLTSGGRASQHRGQGQLGVLGAGPVPAESLSASNPVPSVLADGQGAGPGCPQEERSRAEGFDGAAGRMPLVHTPGRRILCGTALQADQVGRRFICFRGRRQGHRPARTCFDGAAGRVQVVHEPGRRRHPVPSVLADGQGARQSSTSLARTPGRQGPPSISLLPSTKSGPVGAGGWSGCRPSVPAGGDVKGTGQREHALTAP